jgi:hypothetical protein
VAQFAVIFKIVEVRLFNRSCYILFRIVQGTIAVKQPKNTPSARVAEVIESRSPAGSNDSVQGWHNFKMLRFLKHEVFNYFVNVG